MRIARCDAVRGIVKRMLWVGASRALEGVTLMVSVITANRRVQML
jgi:hypothetical protein